MQTSERIHVSIREACEILSVSSQTIYRMRRDGDLRLTKIRRRTFVPISEIERLKAAGGTT